MPRILRYGRIKLKIIYPLEFPKNYDLINFDSVAEAVFIIGEQCLIL